MIAKGSIKLAVSLLCIALRVEVRDYLASKCNFDIASMPFPSLGGRLQFCNFIR